MRLGVCYYPEHWPEDRWETDAQRMSALGLKVVRIGEFAWSKIQPSPDKYHWDWLDKAIETLHKHGLGVILGTPTATPPKWLVDRMPDMLALDEHGRPRKFGSRRHYCFSHKGYRTECRRIVTMLAKRYGNNPAVVMWQTDNEFGCHNTVESYSPAAVQGFRDWLKHRYKTIDAVNVAWGTVFWSQHYQSFEEVDAPAATVTEANPSHRLDYQRFLSDQVASFNREQIDIIRAHSPDREITHNFMGKFTSFDHHKVGRDLDLATWDSYPLGFLELSDVSDLRKKEWMRQGHPDFQAFHHDLYRGCSKKWGVMEQQPGPVNWAPYNPAPLPGMVRLWSLEAIAHGADLLSWFRWRQAPFAQEQMHAGLLRSDNMPAPAYEEAAQVANDLKAIKEQKTHKADVALLFDYEGQWTHDIQPQGKGLDLYKQAFEAYSALRQLALSIDIVSPKADLLSYKFIVVPGLPILSPELIDALKTTSAQVVLLPRTGSKSYTFHIPEGLPPYGLQSELGLKVVRVESLRPNIRETGDLLGTHLNVVNWREHLELDPDNQPDRVANYANGKPLWVCRKHLHYIAGWLDETSLVTVLADLAKRAGIARRPLGSNIRFRQLGELEFAFNYGLQATTIDVHVPDKVQFVLGNHQLKPAGVSAWIKSTAL